MGKTLRHRMFVISLLLVLITAVAYLRIADLGFIALDDEDYVTENTYVQAGLTLKSAKWAFTTMHIANWHPLTWLSHMMDCQLYGLDPGGHHVTNLLFHIANVLLLFLVFNRMTGSLWRSAFVAVLFGIHPLHVESVVWVAERKDVLSTFFWLLTILAYIGYARQPNVRRYLMVVFLFAIGLMSKPMLVTLPLTLLLLDYWPLGRMQQALPNHSVRSAFSSLILEKIPLFAISIVSCLITIMAQLNGKAVNSLDYLPMAVRIDNALVAYASYILKMFWPAHLALYYPHPLDTLPVWKIAGGTAFLICISVLVILYRRRSYLMTGWMWYLITLIPVIGLLQVGGQAMADRYTYIPLIGLFVMIAWGIPDLFGQKSAKQCCRPIAVSGLTMLAIVVVMALAVRTWVQTGYWKDDVSLYGQALRIGGESALMHTNLGLGLVNRGDLDEAIVHYRRALELTPDFLLARTNLAFALAAKGDFDGANSEYQKAVAIEPEIARTKNKTVLAQIHFNLGITLAEQEKFDEAIKKYRQAVWAKPDFVEAYANMGVALKNLGRIDEAIREYRKALSIDPKSAKVHNNLAIALYLKSDYAEAWEEVDLCEKYGGSPHLNFIGALAQKMPRP